MSRVAESSQRRHERLLREYKRQVDQGLRPPRPKSRSELDIIKERHRFIRENEDDASCWEDKLASKYYSSLFREYAVVDLRRYKEGKVAMRWRTEDEVVAGKGTQTCSSIHCEYHEPRDESAYADDLGDAAPLVPAKLDEFEVPFGYTEDGDRKSALVKLTLCKRCARRLARSRGDSTSSSRPSAASTSSRALVNSQRREELSDDEKDEYAPAPPPDLARGALSPPRATEQPATAPTGRAERKWQPYEPRRFHTSAGERTIQHHIGRRRSASPPERR